MLSKANKGYHNSFSIEGAFACTRLLPVVRLLPLLTGRPLLTLTVEHTAEQRNFQVHGLKTSTTASNYHEHYQSALNI